LQFAAITVSGPTTLWTPINKPGVVSDFARDNQANIADLELVGDADNSAFYGQFDGLGTPSTVDGEIAFRFRMSGDQGNARFAGYAWVGVDADRDGTLDLFLSASDRDIGIYETDANSTNSSPGETGIGSLIWSTRTNQDNYEWAPVTATNDPTATSFDIDNEAGTDYFLSFVLPFNQLVSAVTSITALPAFDETAVLSYIAATSTNRNTLNSDINGIEGGTSSQTPWNDEENGITNETGVDGTPIPEPVTTSVIVAFIALALLCVRKRK
jgi:hypothetical protein